MRSYIGGAVKEAPMSLAAGRRLSRSSRHLCLACKRRSAKFAYRGEVRADRDHNLCFRCFRAERERQRARLLAGVTPRPLMMTADHLRPATFVLTTSKSYRSATSDLRQRQAHQSSE